jgi:Cu/Ag efflux protein CusF
MIMSSSAMPSRAAEIALADGQVPSRQVPSTGRVVQVDVDRSTITIEHRPIQRFYMESMTMTFRVKDPTLLAILTPGDKIRFEVERDRDGFIITRIENSN